MQKDLHSIITTGVSLGVPMQTTTAALSTYDATSAAGLGSHDAVEVVRHLVSQATTEHEDEE